ncbi:lycopene cyclase family protein [Streptomyces sp. SP18CS02]|uniref:lycopene cyclase family protein n=1 Tax=Streptomyces sp. SP18CS02 TaxID=3002531 RepID=UPI002E79553C|nr:lycopene cyclase family protein [Streptomyces sp. SP18CS02]MEE1756635.1 lycopene cyclase family protein [Streptomyces sp. SP18CS02]
MLHTDVAIVGAGAAGLSLAYRLCAPGPGPRPRVTVLDAPPGPLRPPERTWCFWEGPGGDFDDLLAASWDRLRVHGPDGVPLVGSPGPLRYKMLRSAAFEAAARERLRTTARRIDVTVHTIRDLPGGGARVDGVTAHGDPFRLRARWVFDSRPPPVPPPARTTLLQHFRGWFVRTDRPVFDPAVADLMDFRTPQPHRGLSFGYVLPLGPSEALVEYTEFSAAVLDDDGYDSALRHYTGEVLGLGRFTVRAAEHGVIPMSDARHRRRAGASVFRIGTAGGATRPSTGYTFAGIQRQSRAVAAALHAGRTPEPPPAHRARHLAMDAVLLRALHRGRIDGPAFFTRLFRDVPAERLLRFLDGDTRPGEEFLIGLRTPVLPMLRTLVELPRLARSPAPSPHRPEARRP